MSETITVIPVPEITSKIESLYLALSKVELPENIAKKINDILIHGDKIPTNLVSAAWDYFAQKKGVKT